MERGTLNEISRFRSEKRKRGRPPKASLLRQASTRQVTPPDPSRMFWGVDTPDQDSMNPELQTGSEGSRPVSIVTAANSEPAPAITGEGAQRDLSVHLEQTSDESIEDRLIRLENSINTNINTCMREIRVLIDARIGGIVETISQMQRSFQALSDQGALISQVL